MRGNSRISVATHFYRSPPSEYIFQENSTNFFRRPNGSRLSSTPRVHTSPRVRETNNIVENNVGNAYRHLTRTMAIELNMYFAGKHERRRPEREPYERTCLGNTSRRQKTYSDFKNVFNRHEHAVYSARNVRFIVPIGGETGIFPPGGGGGESRAR